MPTWKDRHTAAKWFWYGGSTTAALSLALGVWLPAIRAYDSLNISFVRLTPLYFSYVPLTIVAICGLFRRNRDVVGITGGLAILGAVLGLGFCISMVINGPSSNVYLRLSWGHLVLNVAGANLLWLGLSFPFSSVVSLPDPSEHVAAVER
jgi:hypothetical protein